MRVLTSTQVRALAPMSRVIHCLEEAFRHGCHAPVRQVTGVPGGEEDRLLLIMPACHSDGGAAIKVVTYFPDNPRRGMPTIHGVIVVFDETGAPGAVLDGSAVTHLRTGAASALASRYLSREDSAHLALIGTGALAPSMAEAHCTVRPITRVSVCGRESTKVARAAEEIRARVGKQVEVLIPGSTQAAVESADIVCCCTSSATPVVFGRWLKPGAFVDLVGSFSPARRESDDDVVRQARLFVDTFEGALSEAGDLLDPLQRGVIGREQIEGELSDLVRGRVSGRRSPGERIVFKSVGAAIEDLATARMILAALCG